MRSVGLYNNTISHPAVQYTHEHKHACHRAIHERKMHVFSSSSSSPFLDPLCSLFSVFSLSISLSLSVCHFVSVSPAGVLTIVFTTSCFVCDVHFNTGASRREAQCVGDPRVLSHKSGHSWIKPSWTHQWCPSRSGDHGEWRGTIRATRDRSTAMRARAKELFGTKASGMRKTTSYARCLYSATTGSAVTTTEARVETHVRGGW